MATQPLPILSAEQYLELDRSAEFRSEYFDGQMFLMSGGTRNHSRVVGNALAALHRQLGDSACEVAGSDLRLASSKHPSYTYPDIVVTCGPDKFLDNRRDTITDATLVIEVLSPSTRNYDRGEKFLFYRSLPSFSEYLLLSQDSIRAEHHVRQPDGAWLFREFTSASDVVELKSIGCSLQLESLYRRVEFEPKP
jgi:Uma2 family endonuclease